jgi:Pectate lyase superfamily protein
MTIAAETPITSAVANGVTTVFPYAYTLLQQADQVVQGTLGGIVTTYTLGVHYTLTGVPGTGGTTTFLVAPANGTVITQYRSSVIARTTDYQDNGDLLADTVNLDFDRLWLLIQEIFNGGKSPPGALHIPPGEVTTTLLPKASDRAGNLAGFDSFGNVVAVIPGPSGTATTLALDLVSSNNAAKGAGQLGLGPTLDYGANTIGRALSELASVRAYGAVGDGVTNDSAAFQAAANAVYARGGGLIYVPPTGKPYLLVTGINVPEGVTFYGTGRSFHGPGSWLVPQYTDKGSWVQCTDPVNPAFTLGYGGAIRGLNFAYEQPVPVALATYVPTVYPYAIKATQSLFFIDDVYVVGGTHGINIEYLSANGGGTYGRLSNIFLDTLKVGIRFKNVNDTLYLNNYHQRALWRYDSAEVVAYREANLIGWDVNYLDNLQGNGIEFFQCSESIRLTNSTVNNGALGVITQACGYLQLTSVSFNLVKQAVSRNGAVTGQIAMSQVTAQSDIVTGAAADWFFDFQDVTLVAKITDLWAPFVGRGLLRGGSANVTINNVSGAFNGNNAGFACFNAPTGQTISIPTGVQGLTGAFGAPIFGTSAGSVTDTVHFDNILVRGDSLGGVKLTKGSNTQSGYVEFYSALSVRQGYMGFATPGFIELFGDSGSVYRFNTAPITPTYTVAALPAAALAGSVAYASNGRKNGEGAAAGTGVLVFRDAAAWRACDTGVTVAA